jgi:hypothetical protein
VKILRESGVNGLGQHAMVLGKFADSNKPVIGDLGSDNGNESRIPDLAFAIEEPLVGCWFPLLNYFDDLVQLRFLQGLVAIDRFHCFFNFL